MKIMNINMVKGGFLGAAMLLGFTACSDDHYDVVDTTGSGTSTIWQNIKSNSELSDFAEILSRTRVLTTDIDNNNKRQFYSDFLNSPQYLTVWAPKNGTYDAQRYRNILEEIETLRSSGNNKDVQTAIKKEYELAKQFVQNHIARFNYASNVENQQVRLLNSKFCYYDAGNNVFNGVKIDPDYGNVNSSNGMLQVIDGQSRFANNIYDYMSTSEEFSSIYSVLSDPKVDKTVFVPELSVPGAMNEQGEMVYVDSVFSNNNLLLSATGALIKSEDSLYVALIPTNAAWESALNTVKPLVKYAPSYNYTWSASADNFENTGNRALKFNTDSLTDYNAQELIISSMFFNPTEFTGVDKSDSAAVIDHVLYEDSLISTNGLVFYNKAGKGNRNPIFGDDSLDPVKASNGYIFPVETYDVDPAYSFISEQELDMFDSGLYFNLASVTGATTEKGQTVTLTADNRSEDVEGEIEDNKYAYFAVNGRNALRVNIKLGDIFSGHYRIKAIMVPNRICKDNIQYNNKGEEVIENPTFDVEILDDKKNVINRKVTVPFERDGETIGVKQDAVSEITLWEDFEFPYSYWGLPDGAESFPILRISMSYAQQTRGKCKALSIHKIILEPVRNLKSEDDE